MLSLREYRNKADRLADFLPWAALVAPGVVLNKDGRLLAMEMPSLFDASMFSDLGPRIGRHAALAIDGVAHQQVHALGNTRRPGGTVTVLG
mgnify:CR=1 FL=1